MRHIVHRLLTLLFLAITAEGMGAQDRHFICHPAAGKGEEVLFHSVMLVRKLPERAALSVSTTGYVLVYVNGRIATTASLWPYRPDNMMGVASEKIDITDFLTLGRNIISVWYAPCLSPLSGFSGGESQIAASITTVTDGREQCFCDTEKDWLCTIACARMTEKGEDYDAVAYQKDWKDFIYSFTPAWVGAEKPSLSYPALNDIPAIPLRACRIFQPISVFEGRDTTRCYFPLESEGQIRLTLRGAKKGQRISVNGMEYRCLGIEDEQFFTRFTTYKTDSIVISSLDDRRLPEVADAEIIMLKPDDCNNKTVEYLWKR